MLNDAVRLVRSIAVTLLVTPAFLHAQSGSLAGLVVTAEGEKPIVNAEVLFTTLDRSVWSDSAGKFELRKVPDGTHAVTVRAVGYEPYSARMTFRKGERVEADFVLNALTKLATVEVKSEIAKRYAIRLADFDGRRKMGMGKFIDHEYFEKNDTRSWSTIFAERFGSLRAGERGSDQVAVTTSRSNGVPCPVQVYLNGMSIFNGENIMFDLRSLQVNHVIGMEFYTPLFTPVEFSRRPRGTNGGSGCGTLLIWTK